MQMAPRNKENRRIEKRRIRRFDPLLTASMSMGIWLALTVPARGQTIVPVDRALHAPLGLTFRGRWQCSEGSSSARLKVEGRIRMAGRSARALGLAWTEIAESQEGFNRRYFVGYDRDHRQFLIIDAEDPAYAAYQTDGWEERRLTLTSVSRRGPLFPTDRFVYEVNRPYEFTVAWEWLDGNAWTARDRYTCRKMATNSP